MSTPLTPHRNLVTLAQLLRRIERSRVPVDPEQYRALVTQITQELAAHPQDAGFDALLAAVPELAELWENQQYAYAGLCRSPLDAAVRAEQAAREVIGRVARG